MPYMPTLTPKTTPTDRHIWQSQTGRVWVFRLDTVRSRRPRCLVSSVHSGSGGAPPGRVDHLNPPRPQWPTEKKLPTTGWDVFVFFTRQYKRRFRSIEVVDRSGIPYMVMECLGMQGLQSVLDEPSLPGAGR